MPQRPEEQVIEEEAQLQFHIVEQLSLAQMMF